MGDAETFAVLLGIAQDAGVPQAGCGCERCSAAYKEPDAGAFVTCLGLVDRQAGRSWLVDATPDVRWQWAALKSAAPGCELSGILLTHAHMGHFSGLVHFGKEAANSRRLSVWCTRRMEEFLLHNQPWRSLFTNRNLEVQRLQIDAENRLSDRLSAEPLLVPHRNEFSDTVAYRFRGPRYRLLYCPDIDDWDRWEQDIGRLVSAVDYALLDATFYDEHELPHRNIKDVPHPLAKSTTHRLTHASSEIVLVHLNHTNPLLESGSERGWVESQGLSVGRYLQRWPL